MSGDASDLTRLRRNQNIFKAQSIENSAFPTENSSSNYTQYLKMNAITTSCHSLNNCYAKPCYVNGTYLGACGLDCAEYDIYGRAPITYFNIPYHRTLNTCNTYNLPINNDNIQFPDNFAKAPMFSPPLRQSAPAIKMKMNSIICCTDKNIKKPKVVIKTPIYMSEPILPTIFYGNK